MLQPRIFVTHRALTNTQRAATLRAKDERIAELQKSSRRLQIQAGTAETEQIAAAEKAAAESDKV
jgi:hypothetical protein